MDNETETLAKIVFEDSWLYLHILVASIQWLHVPPVRAECEGWISRAIAQLYIKYCNAHNIMRDISEFKSGQIIGVHLAGISVTRTASLCGVSRATVFRVMSAYYNEGWSTSNRSNCRRKRKLSERDVQVLTWIVSKKEEWVKKKRFPPPASHSDLATVLQEEWLKIPLATVQDLYLSFRRHIDYVLATKGGSTPY